jgi:exodeoxyribonuclease VII small subunit
MIMDAASKTIAHMSFEEALIELEQIVNKIDSGQETLANSIANFERGIVLKQHCETLLQQAKLKIEQITQQNDGSIVTSEIEL